MLASALSRSGDLTENKLCCAVLQAAEDSLFPRRSPSQLLEALSELLLLPFCVCQASRTVASHDLILAAACTQHGSAHNQPPAPTCRLCVLNLCAAPRCIGAHHQLPPHHTTRSWALLLPHRGVLDV